MSDLRKEIEHTYNYGKCFGVKYGKDVLWKRLISTRKYQYKEFEAAYGELGLTETKIPREIFESKLKKAREVAIAISKKFDRILFIGLTGSVAALYPEENDDIDLMIITSDGCLWLTRLCLRIYVFFQRIPHRKFGKLEGRDEFCFNLWLDNSELSLPESKRNLKNAMDLTLMIPLHDKKGAYYKFLKENGWVKKFVANTYSSLITVKKIEEGDRKKDWYQILSSISYYPQKWYLSLKKQPGLITKKMAFFHRD